MEKKHLAAVLIVLVAVVGLVVWPHLKWNVVLKLETDKAIGDKGLGRFPTPQQLVAFEGTLVDVAKRKGYEDAQVGRKTLEARKMPGGVVFHIVTYELRAGGKSLAVQRRVEGRIDREALDALQEAGFEVSR